MQHENSLGRTDFKLSHKPPQDLLGDWRIKDQGLQTNLQAEKEILVYKRCLKLLVNLLLGKPKVFNTYVAGQKINL